MVTYDRVRYRHLQSLPAPRRCSHPRSPAYRAALRRSLCRHRGGADTCSHCWHRGGADNCGRRHSALPSAAVLAVGGADTCSRCRHAEMPTTAVTAGTAEVQPPAVTARCPQPQFLPTAPVPSPAITVGTAGGAATYASAAALQSPAVVADHRTRCAPACSARVATQSIFPTTLLAPAAPA
jgi:hypothetical protein